VTIRLHVYGFLVKISHCSRNGNKIENNGHDVHSSDLKLHRALHSANFPSHQGLSDPDYLTHDSNLATTSGVVCTIEHSCDVSALECSLDRGSSGVSRRNNCYSCLYIQDDYGTTYIPPAVMYISKKTSSMCIAYLNFWPIDPALEYWKSCIQRSPGKTKLNSAKQRAAAKPSR
jgi:hypothetical protein